MGVGKNRVFFADKRLEEAFIAVGKRDPMLHKWIAGAMKKLGSDPFSGVAIRKNMIPKFYGERRHIDNLWKLNLPGGWRLIYSIVKDEIGIMSIILEWLPHKKYERRFGY